MHHFELSMISGQVKVILGHEVNFVIWVGHSYLTGRGPEGQRMLSELATR